MYGGGWRFDLVCWPPGVCWRPFGGDVRAVFMGCVWSLSVAFGEEIMLVFSGHSVSCFAVSAGVPDKLTGG